MLHTLNHETVPNQKRKSRSRKSKAEKEAYDKLKREQAVGQTLFEKSIAAQLDVPFEELRDQIPLAPAWGIKKNSEVKNVFWYGFKDIFPLEQKVSTFWNPSCHLET
jgi:transposase